MSLDRRSKSGSRSKRDVLERSRKYNHGQEEWKGALIQEKKA